MKVITSAIIQIISYYIQFRNQLKPVNQFHDLVTTLILMSSELCWPQLIVILSE